MQEIVPGSVDAAAEKHVPVIKTEGQKVTVSVGSTAHPMQEEHYIEWVALHTKQGNQRKELKPGMAPEVSFMLCEEDEPLRLMPIAIYTDYGKRRYKTMKKYVCSVCGYIYDEAAGDPDNGIAAGTKWEDVPDDFVCPLCGVGKDQFEEA